MDLPTEQKFFGASTTFLNLQANHKEHKELPGRFKCIEDPYCVAAKRKGGKSIKSKEKNASVSFFFLFTIPVCLFVSFFFSSVTGEKKKERGSR